MNSGLDWMWVEMLTVMVDWIGLDWIEKWTNGHLWSIAAAHNMTLNYYYYYYCDLILFI